MIDATVNFILFAEHYSASCFVVWSDVKNFHRSFLLSYLGRLVKEFGVVVNVADYLMLLAFVKGIESEV